jgi:hypothetical protein
VVSNGEQGEARFRDEVDDLEEGSEQFVVELAGEEGLSGTISNRYKANCSGEKDYSASFMTTVFDAEVRLALQNNVRSKRAGSKWLWSRKYGVEKR